MDVSRGIRFLRLPRAAEQIRMQGGDGAAMTREEASRRYQIPMEILEEYEGWGLCGAVRQALDAWQYGDQDLERLSTIMALHDMGFTAQETERYMRLALSPADTRAERLRMLERRRSAALDEIHLRERQLQRLDYLRHKMRGQTRNSQER